MDDRGGSGSTNASFGTQFSWATSAPAPSSRHSTPRRRGSLQAQVRVERTAATADRIAQLMSSMHNKLERVEADKEEIARQAAQDSIKCRELELKLEGVDRRSEQIDLIANKMREETRRIREKEDDLERREGELRSHTHHPKQLTVDRVRTLYDRIVHSGNGAATRSALLHCLQTDEDIRSLFCDESSNGEDNHLQRLFHSCGSGDDREISWAEFNLTVLGPQHPSIALPSLGSPGTTPANSYSRQRRSVSTDRAPSEMPDPSPPPPKHPELSPMFARQHANARAPSPPPSFCSHQNVTTAVSRAGSGTSNGSMGRPPSSSASVMSVPSNPEPESDRQHTAMLSALSAADVDPMLDPSAAVRTAVAHSIPFVDTTFPPTETCSWVRVNHGSVHQEERVAFGIVSGVQSDRLFLGVLCLLGDPRTVVPENTVDVMEGHAVVHLGGAVVLVDTLFPSVDGCALHASAGPSQLWIMLAEKAYAKQQGGYTALERNRSTLAATVAMIVPNARVVPFALQETALPALTAASAAGHLQLLLPLPSAASRLNDIGTVYALHSVANTENGALYLVWCPVMSQGDVSIDAQWVTAQELLSFFCEWHLVDVGGVFAEKKGVVEGFLPMVPNVEESMESAPSELNTLNEDRNMQDVMSAVMNNNNAVVREVQVHREQAEEERHRADTLQTELDTLRADHHKTLCDLESELLSLKDTLQAEKGQNEVLHTEISALSEHKQHIATLSNLFANDTNLVDAITDLQATKSDYDIATELFKQNGIEEECLSKAVFKVTRKEAVVYREDEAGAVLEHGGVVWREGSALAGLQGKVAEMELELQAERRVAAEMSAKEVEARQLLETHNTELRAIAGRCKDAADIEAVNSKQLSDELIAAQRDAAEKRAALEELSAELATTAAALAQFRQMEMQLEVSTHEKTQQDEKVLELESEVERLAQTREEMLSTVNGEAHRKITESVGQVLQLQESVEDALKSADDRYEELNVQYQGLLAQHEAVRVGMGAVEVALEKEKEAHSNTEQDLNITLTQLELQTDAHKNELASLRAALAKANAEVTKLAHRDVENTQKISVEMPQLQNELQSVITLHQELATKHVHVVQEMEVLRDSKRKGLDLTATEVEHLYSELARAEEKIAGLQNTIQNTHNDKQAMETQVHTARVEITELLREVSQTRSRERSESRGASLAISPSAEPCRVNVAAHDEAVAALHDARERLEVLEVAHRSLQAENLRLVADSEQLNVQREQMHMLDAQLSEARARADAAESRTYRESALVTSSDSHTKQLQLANTLLEQELQIATDQVSRLTEEVHSREQKLDKFASDSASLQRRVQELLGLAAISQQQEERHALLEGELAEAKEGQRSVAAKWRRVAASLKDAKTELEAKKHEGEEHKDAMRIAAREIQALHHAREEHKRVAEDERKRTAALVEEQADENRELRLEMLKVISERNALAERIPDMGISRRM